VCPGRRAAVCAGTAATLTACCVEAGRATWLAGRALGCGGDAGTLARRSLRRCFSWPATSQPSSSCSLGGAGATGSRLFFELFSAALGGFSALLLLSGLWSFVLSAFLTGRSLVLAAGRSAFGDFWGVLAFWGGAVLGLRWAH